MPDAPFGRMLVTALGIAACAFGAASFAHARGASDDVLLGAMATLGVFVPTPAIGRRTRLTVAALSALATSVLITHASFTLTGNRACEVVVGLALGAGVAVVFMPKLVASQPFTLDMQPPRTFGYLQIGNAAIQGLMAFTVLSLRQLYFRLRPTGCSPRSFASFPSSRSMARS